MRKVNLLALLLLASTVGNLHAESLRSGGCSDLYGAGPSREVSTAEAKPCGSRIHLVSTNAGDSEVHPVGLFHRGGCSSGGCLAPLGPGVQSVQIPYAAPAARTYYQAPVTNYYQGPVAPPAVSPECASCGNAVIAYGNTMHGNMSNGDGAMVVSTDQRSLMDCGPVNSYKVVLEPKYFTETRAVCTTEYQNEIRYRTRVVPRTMPVETQDYKTITVMVPRSETKTIEYTVLVPHTSERTVDVVDTVPVWTEVSEQYTVKVPQVIDVPEEYKVRVAQLADQQFTYTVQVPQAVTETRIQSVTNAVPVTKTRTVQNCQPVTRMQSVTKDYGHWEDRIEEVTLAAQSPVVDYSVPTYSQPAYSPPVMEASPVSYAVPGYGSGVGAGPCGAGHNTGCGGHAGCRLFRRGGCGTSLGLCGGCGHAGGCSSSAGCGSGLGMGGCGSAQVVYVHPSVPHYSASGYSEAVQYTAPTTQAVTRRVWVPNVVTEQVSVVENVSQSQEVAYTLYEQHTEQVPYECTYIVYRPETRTGTRKVVNYVEESRTRNRKVVQYNDETRTRTRKQLSYKQETRTETIPVISYTNEKRTKEVTYTVNVPETKVEPFTTTRFETVNEEVSEAYTVSVPYSTSKEVQVQVCRMIPKLVPVTIYPYADVQQAVGCANGCGGSPEIAPAMPSTGCTGCASGCAGCQ